MALQSTCRAFAALLRDGRVITWGDKARGGDSGAVEQQLVAVRAIQAADDAFAALKTDGSVVSWGLHMGRKVQERCSCVQATGKAFAAILEDGGVAPWLSRS